MILKSKLNFEKFEKNFQYLKLTMAIGKIVNFLDSNVSFNSISKKLDYSKSNFINSKIRKQEELDLVN